MSNEHQKIHPTSSLTPEAIRGARFSQRADGYAPEEVHEFLEQVAAAVQVMIGEPGPAAVRAELLRVSDSTQRIVIAAQEAAERLQEQGARDARTIVEEARHLATELQQRAEGDTQRVQQHVEELRSGFIDELRDMYDRIGAALYRFERASSAAREAAPAQASQGPPAAQQAPPSHGPQQQAEAAPAPPPGDETAADHTEAHDEEQPLVDLREMQRQGEQASQEAAPVPPPSHEALAAETPGAVEIAGSARGSDDAHPAQQEPEQVADAGGGWLLDPALAASEPGGDIEQLADAGARADQEPTAQPAESAGGWLIDDAAAPHEQQPSADDDERAEALLRGIDDALATPAARHGLPEPPSLTPQPESAIAPEYQEIRQFILQSVHEGSSRDAIEWYLSNNLGVEDAGALIDRIMGEAQPPGTQQ